MTNCWLNMGWLSDFDGSWLLFSDWVTIKIWTTCEFLVNIVILSVWMGLARLAFGGQFDVVRTDVSEFYNPREDRRSCWRIISHGFVTDYEATTKTCMIMTSQVLDLWAKEGYEITDWREKNQEKHFLGELMQQYWKKSRSRIDSKTWSTKT